MDEDKVIFDDEEKNYKKELDIDSESKRAQIVLDSMKEEETRFRKGESDLFNALTFFGIIILILFFLFLLYYLLSYYEIVIPKL
ncbi:MAG: hypothetical protein QXD98_02730 [Candidatus Diapherotrites archaeon]